MKLVCNCGDDAHCTMRHFGMMGIVSDGELRV